MDVSPIALRKETVQVLNEVEAQIKEIREISASRDIPATKLTDQTGAFVMVPLLMAKSQCLATLTALNEQARRR